MIHANKYKKMKLPIPVVTSFFLSAFGKFIFIPFAMKQVMMKRTIIKIIDVHLRSSFPSISSKRNVAIAPPIIAKQKRIQKSMLVRFLVRFCCSSETTGSGGGISDVSVDSVSIFDSDSSFGSGSHSSFGSGSGSFFVGSCVVS